jgi:hypothetical protein
MKGVKQAAADHPASFDKPILLPVFTEFKTEAERAGTIAAMKDLGIESVSVKAPDLAARLAATKPGEILFVDVGKVPPAVFENIFKEATLPVILEGKNLTNTMVDNGKPFLNILGNIDDIRPELFKEGVTDAAREPIINAFRAFTREQFGLTSTEAINRKAIARYYAAAKDLSSPVGKLFTSLRRDPAALESDLVAMSLLELDRQITGRANGTIKPNPIESGLPPGALGNCAPQFSKIAKPARRGYAP